MGWHIIARYASRIGATRTACNTCIAAGRCAVIVGYHVVSVPSVMGVTAG
jgi:hypothetical protein